MKGIVLAGGAGTRLYPITKVVGKALIPVYDKPMIYYPISVLLLAGIKEILIISTPHDIPRHKELLGTGEQLGVKFEYIEQPKPEGLAQAFILGESFIGSDSVALVLGDNIFYGHGLSSIFDQVAQMKEGGIVFGYSVKDPERYGVVEFDQDFKVLSLEEKPSKPKSSFAVPGLYFYDNDVVEIAKNLKPSPRGELEITDVNIEYLKRGTLKAIPLGRGYAWLDTGTFESLLQACTFVQTIQERQGLKISCIEEIAFNKGYIDRNQLNALGETMSNNEYGQYLMQIANNS